MPDREACLTLLFDRFASDLATVTGVEADMVRCPLCLKDFGRHAIADPSPEGLSIEHIIPSTIGGKDLTLTCRRCNNTTASSIESHFVRMVRATDWSSGDGSILHGSFRMGEETLPLHISWTDGTAPVTFRIPGGKPEVLERYRKSLAAFGEGDEFNFNVKLNYKGERAQQGLLRIAYLALFQTFGYQYVLTPAGETLRSAILEGDSDTLSLCAFHFNNVLEHKEQPPLRVLFIGANERTVAFLVMIRLNTAQVRFHAVLMPGPELLQDPDAIKKTVEIARALTGKQFSL